MIRALRLSLALMLALLVWLPATSAGAATYTVTADRDSWLNEATVTQNNGTSTTLRASTGNTGASENRPVIGFTLPSIPSNETITSAVMNVRVTTVGSKLVTVYRITASWTETGVTWSNLNTSFNGTAEASFTPSVATGYSIDLTALVQGWRNGTFANHGVMLSGANGSSAVLASRESTTVAYRPQLVITTAVIMPSLVVLKSTSIVSDPFNGTTNPKMIPGATIRHTITASNSTAGTADSGSTVFTAAVPSTMKLYVGDAGGTGSGPVVFTDGSTSSGLTYSYTSLSSTTDGLAFSTDGGVTYTYTPVADSSGCDTLVTNVKVTLSGTFAGKTGSTDPSMTLQMLMQPK